MNATKILKQFFGHESFRGQQGRVIERVLSGGHSLVIMPTGMGKSLCFQIPALVLCGLGANHIGGRVGEIETGKAGASGTLPPHPLCLVISPLIALMKDQVDSLRARGIDAEFINSSLDRRQRAARYATVAAGRHALLYVTPERFRKPEFLESISRRDICLLAVDEAHCISEWGHDFRPDYTRLAEIRETLGNPTTIALTATATPDVQKDIVKQLGLQPHDVETFHEGIDRPNLTLDVKPVWGADEKRQQIARMILDHRRPGIVYFTLIRTLMEYSGWLENEKIPHLVYHGQLNPGWRRQVQERFMEGDHLVLATNAFGMGIDKENIRFVVHADIPGSMESYYQEIGRAGRDGLPSVCRLLYDQDDLETQMEFLRWSNPDAEFYRRTFDLLSQNGEQINAFGSDWLAEKLMARRGRHDHRLETALAILERWGAIELENDPFRVEVVSGLPERLTDEAWFEAKRVRDQQKLLALVQYARHEGDRKAFIHEYFGLPYAPSE